MATGCGKRNFKYVFGVVLLLFLAITIADIIFVPNYLAFPPETFKQAESLYWSVFWSMTAVLGVVVGAMYYIFRRDGTETAAVIVGYFALIWSGLEDILFYIFQGRMIPDELPWLYNTPAGLFSQLLGYATVNLFTLIINAAAFVGMGMVLVYILWKTDF